MKLRTGPKKIFRPAQGPAMARRSAARARPPSAEVASRRRPAPAAAYLAGLDDSIAPHLRGAVRLERFLARAAPLSLAERRRIVGQAILLLEQFYAHLPMKRAMHGIDPVRRLELLGLSLKSLPSDLSFHHEMSEIFMSLRDLHTNYLLPRPYNKAVAFLPFTVEECFERGTRQYIVGNLLGGFRHPGFRIGARILTWNWIPIERAVMLIGGLNAGSNEAARRARGVARLTMRPLFRSLPPDENQVVVEYSSRGGRVRELRLPWLVFALPPEKHGGDHDAHRPAAMCLGIDLEGDLIRRTKKHLYKPQVVAAERRLAARRRPHAGVKGNESIMPAVFEARAVRTAHGRFAYIRLRTFQVEDVDAFVAEFMRLLALLPPSGLILDLRDNTGGVLTNGERLLQLLTPKRIEPEPLQLRSTAACLELCRRESFGHFRRWLPSMERARETGAPFSAGLPLDTPEACNAVGQRYFGPVVLVTNGLCYSTTDIFTAGFRDHGVGKILGTDANTGAGGANVWTHALICRVLAKRGSARARIDIGLRPLPKGAGLRVALRRSLRVRKNAGIEVEELGIVPDEVHAMTRADVLHGNRDLIAHAARLLSAMPAFLLLTELRVGDRGSVVVVTSQNVDRLDVTLGGRPFGSEKLGLRMLQTRVALPPHGNDVVELLGYRKGKLVARKRIAC